MTRSVGGQNHTCALDTAGTAYCWGQGGAGRLGSGTTASSTTPVSVETVVPVVRQAVNSSSGTATAITLCPFSGTVTYDYLVWTSATETATRT